MGQLEFYPDSPSYKELVALGLQVQPSQGPARGVCLQGWSNTWPS
jgi:hypothetical protein